MAEPKLILVDAFCHRPFSGNPAAVCLMDTHRDAAWMQAVAAEMNLSETAFVCPRGEDYDLRWFTPMVEVDLCGHATLATAKALWHTGAAEPERTLTFHTRSGELTARWSKAEDRITLDFPQTLVEPVSPPEGLVETLGLKPEAIRFVGRNKFDYLVELADEALVRSLSPDFVNMARIKARGVIVTASATPGRDSSVTYDFVSRFFAPASGIDEDPVTGSAHCALSPFWSDRFSRDRLTGYQASRRGGLVHVERKGNRVELGGKAIVICEGRLSSEAWNESGERASTA
ncbi:PhzF family phenazine biosynthesis isomerase [bacterium]|nr:PhzF family phenazine biosynthesis isomerase [bacterium]